MVTSHFRPTSLAVNGSIKCFQISLFLFLSNDFGDTRFRSNSNDMKERLQEKLSICTGVKSLNIQFLSLRIHPCECLIITLQFVTLDEWLSMGPSYSYQDWWPTTWKQCHMKYVCAPEVNLKVNLSWNPKSAERENCFSSLQARCLD